MNEDEAVEARLIFFRDQLQAGGRVCACIDPADPVSWRAGLLAGLLLGEQPTKAICVDVTLAAVKKGLDRLQAERREP